MLGIQALGILVYELIVAETPFADPDNEANVFRHIVNSEVKLTFPRRFPTIAKDLVQKLLHPNPAVRVVSSVFNRALRAAARVIPFRSSNNHSPLCDRPTRGARCRNQHCSPAHAHYIPPSHTQLRLGMLRGGMKDITNHDWFHGMVWSKLEAKEYRAPHTPAIAGDKDVSNFEEYTEDDAAQPFKCPAAGDPFVGF